MRFRLLSAIVVIGLALAGSGCRGLLKKRAPVEEGTAATATTAPPLPTLPNTAPTATTQPPATNTTADADLPTPQDFEEEAFEKITSKNLQAELNRLSKEIGD